MTCKEGYITHASDPGLLTKENAFQIAITNYSTYCQANGTWTKDMGCICEYAVKYLILQLQTTKYLSHKKVRANVICMYHGVNYVYK